MADYTIKNLKDVDDAAVKFGLSPGLEARFAPDALECEQTGLSYQRLAPGFRMPFGHHQKEQEELYVIVGGSGRIKLDDEIQELEQWDAVRVAPEVMRAVEAGPDGIELLAFGAPHTGPGDSEMVPGWWSSDGGDSS
jgi:mannose-6-phosphate isomerase-like protein (cupin superfamily)